MTALPKKRLGRGLAALIGDAAPAQVATQQTARQVNGLRELPIELVRSNTLNPRKIFNEEELDDLLSYCVEAYRQESEPDPGSIDYWIDLARRNGDIN